MNWGQRSMTRGRSSLRRWRRWSTWGQSGKQKGECQECRRNKVTESVSCEYSVQIVTAKYCLELAIRSTLQGRPDPSTCFDICLQHLDISFVFCSYYEGNCKKEKFSLQHRQNRGNDWQCLRSKKFPLHTNTGNELVIPSVYLWHAFGF